jgi:hypothetical protein
MTAAARPIRFIWHLPQETLARLLRGLLRRQGRLRAESRSFGEARVYEHDGRWAVSLGRMIFVPYGSSYRLRAHEYGHTRQSRILGWLYLPVVGLPSITINLLSRRVTWFRRHYYDLFPERWANRLAHVEHLFAQR